MADAIITETDEEYDDDEVMDDDGDALVTGESATVAMDARR